MVQHHETKKHTEIKLDDKLCLYFLNFYQKTKNNFPHQPKIRKKIGKKKNCNASENVSYFLLCAFRLRVN